MPSMPFQKILNFRDVGASVNASTKNLSLRTGLFFRSGLPDDATAEDCAQLINEYNIKTIVDLRTDSELVEQARKYAENISSSPALEPPDPAEALRIPGIEYKYISLNGHAYSWALVKQLSYWDFAKLGALYAFGWRVEAISVLGQNVMAQRGLIGLAEDSLTHSTSEVKQIFDVLSDESNYPLLVHCTQGKDRTGLTVLLVLLVLEAPLEAISKDYKMSEAELVSEREIRLGQIRSIGLPDEFADCAEGWVEAVAKRLDVTHGGVRSYLQTCGVSQEQQEKVRSILQAS